MISCSSAARLVRSHVATALGDRLGDLATERVAAAAAAAWCCTSAADPTRDRGLEPADLTRMGMESSWAEAERPPPPEPRARVMLMEGDLRKNTSIDYKLRCQHRPMVLCCTLCTVHTPCRAGKFETVNRFTEVNRSVALKQLPS